MGFKKEVHESREVVKKSETWSLDIDGYDVYLYRRDDGVWNIGINLNGMHAPFLGRMPIVNFYPKHVDDLDRLAEKLPSVLREIATAMKAEGLSDLRDEMDKHWDDHEAELDRIRVSS